MSPALMRGDTGGLASAAYLSNPIVSSKRYLSGFKTTNCTCKLNFKAEQLKNINMLLKCNISKIMFPYIRNLSYKFVGLYLYFEAGYYFVM